MGLIDELKDIVILSKEAGISLSESINLYKMYQKDSSEDKKPAAEKKEPEKTEVQDTRKEPLEGAPQNEPQPAANDNIIDYKSKYEELEQKLDRIQQENTSKDLSEKQTKSDIEIVNDITRAFM